MNPERDAIAGALRRLTVATVALYVVLIVAVGGYAIWGSIQRSQIRDVATRANAALCSLRADLEVRTASAQKFLADHPQGIPGISPADIRTSIANQERTVKALHGLICSAP